MAGMVEGDDSNITEIIEVYFPHLLIPYIHM